MRLGQFCSARVNRSWAMLTLHHHRAGTKLAEICKEITAKLHINYYLLSKTQESYSEPSHFGLESCTDGPDEVESLVRVHVVGLTLLHFSGKVHDATVSTPSALSCLHLTFTTPNQFYLIIKQSLKARCHFSRVARRCSFIQCAHENLLVNNHKHHNFGRGILTT